MRERGVDDVYVFREPREDPANGRHFEELQRRVQHVAQQARVERARRVQARYVRHQVREKRGYRCNNHRFGAAQ